MWTILRYRFICIFYVLKIFFLSFFYAKINFFHLFIQYVLQLQLCLVQKLHLLFMKVGSHFYSTTIFRVYKAFSLLVFYMGFIFLSGVFLRAYLGFSKKPLWEH